MALIELLDKLPFVERINDLLVVESDISGLRGAVFVRIGQDVQLLHEAQVNYDDFNEGLKALVAQLRQHGWQGQQAVLLNPAVVTSLITLPVPPRNKLSPQEIAEQVKWEMEPLVAQQARQLAIGQLLVQQGYMDQAQVEEVLAVQNEANASPQRDKLYKKFGEQALAMHFVRRMQLDSIVRRQPWFKGNGEHLHCGWQAQSAVPQEGGFSWLASAVNKNLLRQWQAAFIAAGLKLHGCLPAAGNSLGVAGYLQGSSQVGVEHAVVCEVHANQLMLAQVTARRLTQMQVLVLPQHEALSAMSDFIHQLDDGEAELPVLVVVDATGQSAEQAAVWLKDVANVLGREPAIMARIGQESHAGLLGAARMVMNAKPWLALTEVPVGEPAPVWYKRGEFRAGMAVAAMVVAMVIAELSLWGRYWGIYSQKDEVDAALGKQRQAIALLQQQVDRVHGLQNSIETNQQKAEQLKNGLTLIERDLPQRNQNLVDILRAFELSVADDVVVDSMTEDTRLGFSIYAWALSEAAAQEFAKRFQVNVHLTNYHIRDSTVNEQPGRLGLMGYAIKFKLTRLRDDEWAAANAALRPLARNGKK